MGVAIISGDDHTSQIGSGRLFGVGDFKRVLTTVIILKLATTMSFMIGWYYGDYTSTYSFFLHYDRDRPTGRYEAMNNALKSPTHRLAAWDGQWYLEIARNGYLFQSNDRERPVNYAFFPAFPKISAVLGLLCGGPLFAGLVLNQMLSVIDGLLLFGAVKRFSGSSSIALTACGLFFVYPTAGFLNLFYSEALFVFLLLLYLLLSEDGSAWLGALVGLALGLTRPQGVLAILWHIGRLGKFRRPSLSFLANVLGPAVGFGLFSLYAFFHTESVGAVITIQRQHGRTGNVLRALVDLVTPGDFVGVVYLFCVLVSLLTLPWVFKHCGGAGALSFSLAMLIVPFATGSTLSISRFLLGNIPQYIVLAHFLARFPRWRVPLFVTLAALQGIANVYLINWRWVA